LIGEGCHELRFGTGSYELILMMNEYDDEEFSKVDLTLELSVASVVSKVTW